MKPSRMETSLQENYNGTRYHPTTLLGDCSLAADDAAYGGRAPVRGLRGSTVLSPLTADTDQGLACAVGGADTGGVAEAWRT